MGLQPKRAVGLQPKCAYSRFPLVHGPIVKGRSGSIGPVAKLSANVCYWREADGQAYVKRSVPVSARTALFLPLCRKVRASSASTKTYGRPRILVTDGLGSADESILRQLGELRDGTTKASDQIRWRALAYLTEFRIVFRLRGVR